MDKGTSRNIDSDQLAPETPVAGACGPLSLLRNPARRELSPTLVLAHGAGAPMDSPFMDGIAALSGQERVDHYNQSPPAE